MRGHLLALPDHLARSAARAGAWAASSVLRSSGKPARALALAGMGGSAVAGDLARAALRPLARVPFEVVRDYRLPAWLDAEGALIASSYSGDTEETLAAFREARERGVPVWAVTSGGELARLCEADRLPVFPLPPGLPPRAALGWSFPPVLAAAAALSGAGADEQIRALAAAAPRLARLGEGWSAEQGPNPTRELAARLAPTIPVLYAGAGLYEAAAVRWRAQLAENAKMLAFHHVLPEANHNEVVGWQENAALLRGCRALFLTGDREHPRVARRVEATAELLRGSAGGVEIVRAPSGTPLEELLGLVVMGDWVSLWAAAEHGVEPVPVERIDRLKAMLREPRP